MTPIFQFLFEALDERLRLRKPGRKVINKVFPHHWSFLLGEAALFSFAVLVLTGIFLAMFYRPVPEDVVYVGSAELFSGRTMPAAYASIVELTHDVPGGLLFRRLHRGAAYLFFFVAIAHLLRVLLTGAFRRPREFNTHVGTILLLLVIAAGYTGQNLVYDLLSGLSLRIAYAFLQSVPLIGDNLVVAVFGGEFPGEVVSRFFILHILIIPGLIAGVMTVHLLVVGRQRHTQFAHAGVDGERQVVGWPLWPSHFAKTLVLVLAMSGLLGLFSVAAPWSDVDLHGPLRVGQATALAHAEVWLFWVQGAITIAPGIEWSLGPVTINQVFLAGVVLPMLVFAGLFAYPFIDARLHPQQAGCDHHVLQRPLEAPLRAGIVLGVTTFVLLLTVANANDVIARWALIPVETIMWVFRIAVLVVPPLVGVAVWARGQALLRARAAEDDAAGRPEDHQDVTKQREPAVIEHRP